MVDSSRKVAIASAMLKALSVWILVYVFVIFYKAFEKYDKVNHIVVKHVNKTKEIILEPEIQIVEKIVEIEEPPRPISAQERAIFDRVPALLDQMEEAKLKQERATRKIQTELEELMAMRTKYEEETLKLASSPKTPTRETTPTNLSYLPSLLRLPSLTSMDDAMLDQVFQHALQELQDIIHSKDTVEWGHLKSYLHPNYQRVIDQPEAESCPAPMEYVPDETVVRASHLKERVQQIESALRERTNARAIRRILASDSTKQALDTAIAEHAPKPSQQPKQMQRQDLDRVCILDDELKDMLEEGLSAVKMNGSLERVLIGWVSKLDPNEKNLILDPILPKSAAPDVEPPSHVNLRQILDTEMLQQSSKVLDGLVDLISGYNDFVDQNLDKLLAANPESKSVGEIAIGELLRLAGRVEVPNVMAQIPSKAGILK